MQQVTRCAWAGSDPLYCAYHDQEWGVPLHDDQKLFECLLLEGAQSGLSWITILRKRESYRAAFDGFDATRIARYGTDKIESLLQDPGIVRNRLKVEAAVTNARCFLEAQEEFGSFDAFVWRFAGNAPKRRRWRSVPEIPASTPQSDAMSRELKGRGFKFAGSTICYAFMQATGMVNDHVMHCFRYKELTR